MKVGVIALQGAVSEHMDSLNTAFSKLEITGKAVTVRRKAELKDIEGLIIPGGESTTISRLLKKADMMGDIVRMAEDGMPILGTCAGSILLAKEGDLEVEKTDTTLLGLMSMRVNRNAFGRQKESFETTLEISGFDTPYKAVFIRAPGIEKVWSQCRVLATFEDKIVMAREGNLIAVSFHPELTGDIRVHTLLLDMIMHSK
jgi:5'-phosphate synthase pdxT subunit